MYRILLFFLFLGMVIWGVLKGPLCDPYTYVHITEGRVVFENHLLFFLSAAVASLGTIGLIFLYAFGVHVAR
jgi:hypothetical protein